MSRCASVTSGPMSQPRRPSPTVKRRHPLGDLLDQVVGDRLDGDDDGDRHAALAGRAEAGVDRGVGDEVEVGVRQHEHVVLRAAERLHALAVRACRSRRCTARSGSSRRTRSTATSGCVEQPVDGDLVAVQHGEDAVGQAGLLPELRRARSLRTGPSRDGFRIDGVAGRDRDREEPHRHHRREVERADDADDAERLARGVDVDAGRHVLGVLALEVVREAGRELDDLLAARDLAERIGQHLAVLGGDDLGELVLARR